MRYLQALILLYLIPITAQSQTPVYYPENPTWEDTITVVCGGLLNTPCELLNAELIVGDMEYTAITCHFDGLLSMPCSISDTFKIKVPDHAPGIYTFTCLLNLNQDYTMPFDSTCTVMGYSEQSVQIPVANPVGLESIEVKQQMVMYPNPTNGLLHVEHSIGTLQYSFYVLDVLGRPIKAPTESRSQRDLVINCTELSVGIYYAVFQEVDGRRVVRQFAVNR
jgi:hypothetical protein